MAGQVFVVRGDLRRLACDAQLIPSDIDLRVGWRWSDDDADGAFADAVRRARRPEGWGFHGRRALLLPERDGQAGEPAQWLVNVGADIEVEPSWFAEGARQFVAEAAAALHADRSKVLHGRSRPLLALPVIGTGFGGGGHFAGHIVAALLPALHRAAGEHDVDIALVTWTPDQHAAAQRERLRMGYGAAALPERLQEDARRLAGIAAAKRLVLFVGAGVGVRAGLPTWSGLLADLAAAAGFTPLEMTALDKLPAPDQARLVAGRLPPEALAAEIRGCTSARRVALSHALLANLPVDEVVTTNYDTLFEDASQQAGVPTAVLPYHAVTDRSRWVLKLHGSVDRPGDRLVLTREDFLDYGSQRAALMGIVQALLITRHMLFVGFSLADDTFLRIAHDVRKVLTLGDEHRGRHDFGTALLVRDEPLLTELWRDDLRLLPMASAAASAAEGPDQLEAFLDAVALEASDRTSHILSPPFGSLLDADELHVRDALVELRGRREAASGRGQAVWAAVDELLHQYGSSHQSAMPHRPRTMSTWADTTED